MARRSWNYCGWLFAVWSLALGGCSITPVLQPASDRAFSFERDTLAFDNETEWLYQDGSVVGYSRPGSGDPRHEYTQRCFAMTRSARQFFQFARFDAGRPRLDDNGYRKLVRAVIAHDPDETAPVERTLIPGYADLRSFSADREGLLKQELGGMVDSYFQRGNWRMVFPFSRDHQEETANSLLTEVRMHRPPVVHLANFPDITINHSVLLYAASATDSGVRFQVYDPNNASRPTTLSFDRASRSFSFPPNLYFRGGAVNVYEVYRSAAY